MLRYIAIGILRGLLTLIGVSIITFAMARLSGNPLDVLLPDTATAQDRAEVARLWGLDRPAWQQYLIFDANALRGDFGTSYKWTGRPSMSVVLERVPATAQLAGLAILLSLLVALPLGVTAATHRGSWVDRMAVLLAMLGQSLPSFWVALVLVWVFSVVLGWLPTSGTGGLDHLILPCVVLSLFPVAALVRLLRSSMLDVLDSEYVKLARLKGLPEWKVTWNHAFRNAAIPPLTFFGTILVTLLTGTVVVESIFAWPGIGSLALDATAARDYPVIQAVALLAALAFVIVNLVVDIAYAWLDPRIRLGGA